MSIDAGEPFIKATYHLEEDGPLIFNAYEEISIFCHISTQFYPCNKAVADKLSSKPVCLQQLINYAKACIPPAIRCFSEKFGDD